MFRRLAEVLKSLRCSLSERDPGQAFSDLPFELRVTEPKASMCVCPSCGYSEARGDRGCTKRPCPRCKHLMGNFVEQSLSDKEREKLSKAASAKAGKVVPTHYQKTCSIDAFNANVEYFYRVKSVEWERRAGKPIPKADKMERAQAAAYSALESACGVKSNGELTPSQIVQKAGGKLGPRGPRPRK